MKWVGNAACMREMRSGVDWKIVLKWILLEIGFEVMDWIQLAQERVQ
jgi:hypothetical protein